MSNLRIKDTDSLGLGDVNLHRVMCPAVVVVMVVVVYRHHRKDKGEKQKEKAQGGWHSYHRNSRPGKSSFQTDMLLTQHLLCVISCLESSPLLSRGLPERRKRVSHSLLHVLSLWCLRSELSIFVERINETVT